MVRKTAKKAAVKKTTKSRKAPGVGKAKARTTKSPSSKTPSRGTAKKKLTKKRPSVKKTRTQAAKGAGGKKSTKGRFGKTAGSKVAGKSAKSKAAANPRKATSKKVKTGSAKSSATKKTAQTGKSAKKRATLVSFRKKPDAQKALGKKAGAKAPRKKSPASAKAESASSAKTKKESPTAVKTPKKQATPTRTQDLKQKPAGKKGSHDSGAKVDKKPSKAHAEAAPKPGVQPLAEKRQIPKNLFFREVPEGAERVIRRGDKEAAIAALGSDKLSRNKDLSKDESPEELIERIAKELDEQHIFKRGALGPPICTKCGVAPAVEKFTIDKELAYCAECAELLHLGETKEARKLDYPSLFQKEGSSAEGSNKEPKGG